ncbi:MAG TPA: FGGY-family carbohydrate kinase, partial [Bacillota bacterium]|nr:FGGY-family carbohydrate kinase [Bacillota bacterium]
VGLTRGVNRKHLVRAVLESIAYQTADVLAAMQDDAGLTLSALKADGGAAKNDFLMQFQSDIINAPVYRPACVETTALGAAYLAGLAVGFWESTEALRNNGRIDRVFEPSMTEAARQEKMSGWKKAVARSLDWSD